MSKNKYKNKTLYVSSQIGEIILIVSRITRQLKIDVMKLKIFTMVEELVFQKFLLMTFLELLKNRVT